MDLDRIVALYMDNSMYYDSRDLRLLWDKPLSYADSDIEAQQKKTQTASDDLKEASNSYEMTPFNGMSTEEASVHELCNGRQFEDVSAIDFFQSLKLHQTSKPLDVCRYEKIRVCYLLNKLREKIGKDSRSEWIGAKQNTQSCAQNWV